MTGDALVLVSRAADYAARAHADQHRKGVAKEPYVNHLAEVAMLLAVATAGEDPVLVAAGWLHDTVEDTAAEIEEIAEQFGADVASVVAEVTDDKSLPKAERKRRQVAGMSAKSARAQLLKLADKTSNVRGVAASPPAGWSRRRLSDYVDWAEEVVARRTVTNEVLERAFTDAAQRARDAFTRLESET